MRAGEATLRPRLAPRPGDALRGGLGRAVRIRPSLSPRGRRFVAIALLIAAALGALYMLWFRDSSFVRVERVRVTGVTGRDAQRLRARLDYAARQMTTLHVDEHALMRALGRNAGVRSLSVRTDFPHAMRIAIVQQLPVAVLVFGGDRAPVAANGLLLPAMPATGVPAIDVGALPAHGRLGHGRALRLVSCAAAATSDLAPRIDRIRELPGKGLVAFVRNGPQIIFGGSTLLSEKWIAAAAVLADPSSRGASYVDVRLPDRPVAGGLQLGFAPQDQVTPPAGAQAASQPGAAAGAATSAAGTTSTSPSSNTVSRPTGTASAGTRSAGAATGGPASVSPTTSTTPTPGAPGAGHP